VKFINLLFLQVRWCELYEIAIREKIRRALTLMPTAQVSANELFFLFIQSQIVTETELAYLYQIAVLEDGAGTGDWGVVDPGAAA